MRGDAHLANAWKGVEVSPVLTRMDANGSLSFPMSLLKVRSAFDQEEGLPTLVKDRTCFASDDPCLLALGKRTVHDCGLQSQVIYFHGLLHNRVHLSIVLVGDLLKLKTLLSDSADHRA